MIFPCVCMCPDQGKMGIRYQQQDTKQQATKLSALRTSYTSSPVTVIVQQPMLIQTELKKEDCIYIGYIVT